MSTYGTFTEVIAKLWDLYMEGRMDEVSAEYFLIHLKHPNGAIVFNVEDVMNLLEKLREAKEEGL